MREWVRGALSLPELSHALSSVFPAKPDLKRGCGLFQWEDFSKKQQLKLAPIHAVLGHDRYKMKEYPDLRRVQSIPVRFKMK